MRKILFYFTLACINKFLKGTRFFRIKSYLLNIQGVEIGKDTKIVGPLNIGYVNKIKIGADCWIGKNFTVDGNGGVEIGDRCDLAPNVIINTGGHQIGNEYRRAGKGLRHNTIIESGSWLGTNVTIVNGAKLEEAVVVAAGAVVTRDVKKNTLVAGVPARVMKDLS